ncbi:hypothetical protein [Taylorella asinigenitalis]|uniref:Putative phage protein n=1 Tax=Taylorella asinigenitalis (strain MCE3) TaxID=1008459 RepID=G4QCT9_TAYAM|nr:hypothetical protein [Taylorella asinigenitalis]AEP36219.1 putative phage protein [Taylorella asinigenitalis MCE3]
MAINAGNFRALATGYLNSDGDNVLFSAESTSKISAVFYVDESPRIIRGHNLAEGEEAIVELVDGNKGGEIFTPFLRNGKPVKLNSKCNVIVLSIPGRYRVVLNGELGASHIVTFLSSSTHEYLLEAGYCCTDCEPPAPSVWVDTGIRREKDGRIEALEEDQYGNKRWVDLEEVKWVDTGKRDYSDDKSMIIKEQKNQVGRTRWVDDEPRAWTDTGKRRSKGDAIEKEQIDQLGATHWVTDEAVVWTDTGDTRCNNHKIEKEQADQLGALRWYVTEETCGYDASYPLPDGGYGYVEGDEIDPEASVEMNDCDGVFLFRLYPTPRKGATVKVLACDGEVLGYARNRSDTAPIVNNTFKCPDVIINQGSCECNLVDTFNRKIR